MHISLPCKGGFEGGNSGVIAGWWIRPHSLAAADCNNRKRTNSCPSSSHTRSLLPPSSFQLSCFLSFFFFLFTWQLYVVCLLSPPSCPHGLCFIYFFYPTTSPPQQHPTTSTSTSCYHYLANPPAYCLSVPSPFLLPPFPPPPTPPTSFLNVPPSQKKPHHVRSRSPTPSSRHHRTPPPAKAQEDAYRFWCP